MATFERTFLPDGAAGATGCCVEYTAGASDCEVVEICYVQVVSPSAQHSLDCLNKH